MKENNGEFTKEIFLDVAKNNIDLFETICDIYNICIVQVQGDAFGFYKNWENKSLNNNYEDYHNKELYQLILNNFPVSKDRKNIGIFGISMGGYGVMNYITKYSSQYSMACSLSGLIGTEAYPLLFRLLYVNSETILKNNNSIELMRSFIDNIFGNMDNFLKDSPMDKIKKLKIRPDFLMLAVGDGIEGFEFVEDDKGSLKLEKMIRKVNMKFYRSILKKKDQIYYFIDRSGGHKGYYWKNEIRFFFGILYNKDDSRFLH
jgi:S-formylglutathione hydrolase FrmB